MKTGVKYVLGNGLRGSFKITKAIERDLVSKTNTAQANTNVKKQSGLPIIIISGKIDYVTESRTWVNVGQYIHNESNNPTMMAQTQNENSSPAFGWNSYPRIVCSLKQNFMQAQVP